MPTILNDARLALRRLGRAPLFLLVTVATLGLAIGGNTAIFSVVHALLLEPLPYPDADRLVRLYEVTPDGDTFVFSAPNYADLRREARSFTDVAVFDNGTFTLTESGPPQRLQGQRVSPAFLSLLGVQPTLGRTFREGESEPGSEHVALISEGLWQTLFGGASDVLGRSIRLNGEAYEVVGVLPGDFGYPDSNAQVWIPAAFTAEQLSESRGAHYIDLIGRLREGVTLEAADAEVAAIAARLAEDYPDTNAEQSMTAVPMHQDLIGDYRPALLVLLGAVGLVLLIACVNVANLFLVRALDRRREMAVRTALGAGRGQLAREVLVESLVVALAGGVLGLGIAAIGTDALVSLQAEDVPRLAGIGMNGPVLLFTLGITLLVGLAFGLVPAWRAARRSDPNEELKDGRGRMERPEHVRLRSVLVVAQVILAVVLLGGAALLGRSFLNLTDVELGFRTEDVLTFNISLPDADYPEPADERRFFQQLMSEIDALPGVRQAGAVFGLPMSNFGFVITVEELDGAPAYDNPAESDIVHVRLVTPGYLETVDIRTVDGRQILPTDREGAPPVLLLNEAAAEMLWPGESAVGHTMRIGLSIGDGITVGGEVVGVVENTRFYGASSRPVPEMYGAHAQFPAGFLSVAIHADGDPMALLPAIRERVAEIDPNIPLYRVRTMAELASADLAQARFYTLLLGAFGAMALALAALGLYGVMAYSVGRRTREIGVRKALGAASDDVVRLVLGQALVLVLLGAAVGLAAGFYSSRLLADLLFELQPTDPVSLVGGAAVLVAVALVAAYVPVRRAVRVDPAVALREDG